MKWIHFRDLGPVVKEAPQLIEGSRYVVLEKKKGGKKKPKKGKGGGYFS